MTTHVSARPGCRDWWMQIAQGEKKIVMGTFVISFTDCFMHRVGGPVKTQLSKDRNLLLYGNKMPTRSNR